MDTEGIPIAFGIFPGNDNGQNTMIPLEKMMIENFDNTVKLPKLLVSFRCIFM